MIIIIIIVFIIIAVILLVTEWFEWMSAHTLGSRDFSSAVSGFCQVFIVTRAKSFFSRLRPTAEDMSAFGQYRKFPPHARKTSGTQGSQHTQF